MQGSHSRKWCTIANDASVENREAGGLHYVLTPPYVHGCLIWNTIIVPNQRCEAHILYLPVVWNSLILEDLPRRRTLGWEWASAGEEAWYLIMVVGLLKRGWCHFLIVSYTKHVGPKCEFLSPTGIRTCHFSVLLESEKLPYQKVCALVMFCILRRHPGIFFKSEFSWNGYNPWRKE